MRNRSPFLVLFFLLLLIASAGYAQTTSGDLVGTVKDATGSIIPGATITVTAESTGVTAKVVVGSTGEFRVGNLLADKYDIVVDAAGFQKYQLRGVLVELNKTSTAPITLSVGTSQSVEVSADSGVVLDTTSTNLSQTFDNQALSDLPTASVGFGVLNTSLLSPGVASTGGIGIGVGPSVGGQRPRNNNFTIEGIDNNNKAVTGPLIYIPNDAVGSFTLITNQFSPEFGHSSGGQFNTTVLSGTNKFHGRAYEYFQNRELNAAQGTAGGKVAIPRYDFNRYGGQFGGPILRDRLFFFGSFERQTTGQGLSYYLCVPSVAGRAAIDGLAGEFNANNLKQFDTYTPQANYLGGAQITEPTATTAGTDNACGQDSTAVTSAAGVATTIPLGNYLVAASTFTNFDALTTSMDYTISSKDSLRGRYIYNTQGSQDTTANLPVFFTTQPFKFHLVALSEFHTFTPNLTNEFRVGFNRYSNTLVAGNFSYPGLDVFPNLTFDDLGSLNLGPDGNAPQFTIQSLYQVTDNVSYVLGKHTLKFGFDGRKYISPQGFTQRARGDYDWASVDEFLHDLAPEFGERSTGSHTYYGDQTALYGYGNDTWRVMPTVTLNVGLRYEFTSVPTGERAQALNAVSSVPGLIDFHAPQPTYTSFAPRFGINWAPDAKTSVRAGFGIAQDVLFDNLGTLSFPPQYSSTQDTGVAGYPDVGSANFLANGGLKPGTGSGTVVLDAPTARSKTSAYLPDQTTPYAETYTLTIQRTIGSGLTAEVGYVGTRGVHLPTQIQYNVTPRVTKANQLPTYLADGTTILSPGGSNATTLADIKALSNILPAFKAAGFTSKITSYQPVSSSNYNGLVANLQGRMKNGLQMNLSYTWSKNMDNATAEVFATVLTPRRAQNSQDLSGDYSRSALDRSHRVSLEVLYDLPFYKNKGFLLRNIVGNWAINPIYTYESPEYATALSGVNSNINGDNPAAIDRPLINPNGIKGTGSSVTAITNENGDTIGYKAVTNAQYIRAGVGTLPTAGRNTLPIRPINNIDLAAYKKITVHDTYSLEFGAQSFNVLNHAQYIPGTIDNVNATSFTSDYSFQTVSKAFFNHPEKVFGNNPRTMQLSVRFIF